MGSKIPEVGPLPVKLPNPALLDLIIQFAKHETNHCLWVDRQRWKDKMAYRQQLDYKCQGNARAFARIRDPSQSGVYEIRHQVSDTAILVPQEDGNMIAYCQHASQFRQEAIVHIHETTATLIDKDS